MSEKDEIILDILEKTYDQVQDIKKDVNDIKIQQAIHDNVVKVHEARSTGLETRMAWLEDKFLEIEKRRQSINGAIKIVLGVCGGLAGIMAFIANLSKFLAWFH